MSSGSSYLKSNGAVDMKIRVMVISRAVGVKVVSLVIRAEAVGVMNNTGTGTNSWAGSGRQLAGRLDILVFRGVLGCSVVLQYWIFFCGVWRGLAVVGDLRLVGRKYFSARCSRAEFRDGCDGVCSMNFLFNLGFYFVVVVKFLQVCSGMVVTAE